MSLEPMANGLGAGVPSASPRATILTPQWRRVPRPAAPSPGPANDVIVVVDSDDDVQPGPREDTTDEAYLQRHEPLAVDERRRWSVPPPASAKKPRSPAIGDGDETGGQTGRQPNRRRSRAPATQTPMFPTPLACYDGVQDMMKWWIQESEAAQLLRSKRLKRRREAYSRALNTTLEEYIAMETEIRKLKNRLAKVLTECAEKANTEDTDFLDQPGAMRGPLDGFEKADQIIKRRRLASEHALQTALGNLCENGGDGAMRPAFLLDSAVKAKQDPYGPAPLSKEQIERIARFAPHDDYALDGCGRHGPGPVRFPPVMTLLSNKAGSCV